MPRQIYGGTPKTLSVAGLVFITPDGPLALQRYSPACPGRRSLSTKVLSECFSRRVSLWNLRVYRRAEGHDEERN